MKTYPILEESHKGTKNGSTGPGIGSVIHEEDDHKYILLLNEQEILWPDIICQNFF